ncbi:MAG: helix-turn-helix domain-containing protein [Cyclonatronaceae bacterium]
MSTLHQDLKAIRKKNRMSVQDVYEKTRISEENIRLIESGELYTRPDANKIYLRSFTRTYGKAVGVSDEDITTALDYMEADMYEGFLAEKYLGSKPVSGKIPPKPPFPLNPGLGKQHGNHPDITPEKSKGRQSNTPLFDTAGGAETDEGDKPSTTSPGDSSDTGHTAADTGHTAADETEPYEKSVPPSRKADTKHTRRISTRTTSIFRPELPDPETLSTTDDPSEGSLDWGGVNRKIVSRKDGNGLFIFLGLVGVLLIVVLIYLLSTGTGDDTDADVATVPGPRLEQPLASDTLAAPLTPDPSQLAAALPDTLILTIYAARGNLEPVRVLSDLYNIQRPYWVEAGRAMQFEFLQDIQVRGNLERMILMYDDRVITDFQEYDPENRVISISREQFLRDPTMRSFSTDVMPDDLPGPVEIIERPRF